MSTNVRHPSILRAQCTDSPRIALIGCGAIAEEYYLPALVRLPYVLEKLILVDPDEARSRRIAEKLDVKMCAADYRDIRSEVDGVIIAVPTELHYPIAMDFLAHGIHVLCEKPLAESASKAAEMVEEARGNGAVLSVNYLQRLIPSFARVKELLSEKTLGDVLSIKYFVGEEFKWPTVTGFLFNSAAAASRGILRDRGAHVFDHICWWLDGKPTVVCSQNDSFGGSEAVAYVRFKYGKCNGEVRLSWLSSFPCKFLIACERGSVEGDVYDYQSVVLQKELERKRTVFLKSSNRSKADIAYSVLSNFVSIVSSGGEPLVSGRDVLDSIDFIDECYANATRFDMPWYQVPEVGNGN